MSNSKAPLEFIFNSILTLGLLLLFEGILTAQSHTWQRTNPGGGGAFSTVAQGPPAANGAGQIIAGSDLSGAYYSWDGGLTWDVYGSTRGLTATHISGMGFHPTDASTFFLAADGGIFKSSNGGGHLYEVLSGGYNTDVSVGPSNTNIVYAAYHPAWNVASGKIYKSVDGGDSFAQVSNSTLPNNLHILKIRVHNADANILFAVTGNGRFAFGPAKVFKSIDGGINWTDITPTADDVMDIALDPVDDNVLYVTTMQDIIDANGICSQGNKGHLHRSTNLGATFSTIADYTGIIFIPNYDNEIIRLIDPRCPFEWYPDAGTWTSTNYGSNWSRTGDVATWGKGYQANTSTNWSYGESYNGHCKTISGSLTDPDATFWTNPQWVFGSFDGGNTYNHLHTKEVGVDFWQSSGFDNVVMLDIDINESAPDEMYIAFADIGLFRSLDGGGSWQMTNDADYTGNWLGNGGNTRSVLCDPDIPGKVWATQQGDNNQPSYVIKSTQAGAPDSWVSNNSGLSLDSFLLGLSLDRNSPINNRTLYVTSNGDVYKSQNDGASWSRVLANGKLYFTAVDAVNSAKVYAGGADGLYYSANAGGNWTKIYEVFASTSDEISPYGEYYVGISDIAVDPSIEGKVSISVYGENVGGIYTSENEGTTWETLYLSSYMRCLAVMPSNNQIIYAGSSFAFYQGFYHQLSEGILMSTDGGQSWTSVNEDMAWLSAVTMDITPGSNPTIFVGSAGTGFQKSPIPITTNGDASIITTATDIEFRFNPTDDRVVIDGDLSNYTIKVLNGLGQEVADHTGAPSPLTIELSALGAGLHFLSMQNTVAPELSICVDIKE